MLSFPSSNDSSSAYNNTSFSSDDNRSANVDKNVKYAMMVSPTTSNVEYIVDSVGSSTIGTNYQTPTSNGDNNDSFTTITRPLSCLPFSCYSTGDIIHPYVEPISVHGTNTASLYDNVVDDFKFELSQVLGVEPRPTHRSLDDLDSILSWNEVSND
jgi:hypothetical protein